MRSGSSPSANDRQPATCLVQHVQVFAILLSLLSITSGCNSGGEQEETVDLPGASALKELGAHVAQEGAYVDLHPVEKISAALQRIKKWPDVRIIVLSSTPVTDEDLQQLKELETLENLALNGTSITDEGVAQLVGLSKLKKLNLRETNVSDAAIDHLARLKSLKQLDLTQTKVSPAGLERLKELLPDTDITLEDVPEPVEDDPYSVESH